MAASERYGSDDEYEDYEESEEEEDEEEYDFGGYGAEDADGSLVSSSKNADYHPGLDTTSSTISLAFTNIT